MTNDELKHAIAAMFAAHPEISISPAGHNKHAKRFVAKGSAQIGWQDELKSKQNIYVERDCVNLSRLSDIDHRIYEARDFSVSMPNHDLFHANAFLKDRDIIAFAVRDIWQVARILADLAA